MTYREHLLSLAANNRARLVLEATADNCPEYVYPHGPVGYWFPPGCSGGGAYEYLKKWEGISAVWKFKDDDQLGYICGLHELAHQILNHPARMFTSDSGIIREEAQAWLWMFAHIKEAIYHDSLKFIRELFGSYLKYYPNYDADIKELIEVKPLLGMEVLA